jgi:hypothetical protein
VSAKDVGRTDQSVSGIVVESTWPISRGHFYALTPDAAVEAARGAGESDFRLRFSPLLRRRTQPLECKTLDHTVAVLAAIHLREGGFNLPRKLTLFEVPDAYGACSSIVDVDFVRRFLMTWRSEAPGGDSWGCWAMFAMTDESGELVCVPVRRPSRPTL